MKKKEPKDKNTLSRRSFIKGASVIAGGAGVLAGGAGALASGAVGMSMSSSGKAAKPPVIGPSTVTLTSEPYYEVYDTDVLIVGGGLAGINAAFTAFAEGANVLIVDKGPFKSSGGCGMNWGVIVRYMIDKNLTFDFNIHASEGLINQKVSRALHDNWDKIKMDQLLFNCGTTTYFRNPDGTIYLNEKPAGGAKVMYNYFPRHCQDEVVRQGISVVDRTMITDLFIHNGRCIGAMGVHLSTGVFRVFRAKATVGAAGPAPWNYGWISVAPISINSPDNTGDLDAIAYNHGCRLQDMEFGENDCMNIYPTGLAATCNGGFAADALEYRYICDSEGDYWMKDIPLSQMNRGRFSREIAQKVLEGKGSPNGGVYLDFRNPKAVKSLYEREVYSRNIKPYKEKFGIDVTKERMEVALEWYESEGHPIIDEHFSTEIPGLFFSVGGGSRGCRFTSTSGSTINGGLLSGTSAALYAQNAPKLKEIDWKPVIEEFQRVDTIRTKKLANFLRPHEVRHAMQRACYDALGPARTRENLEKTIAELERIKLQDFPRMALANDTKQFNNEWQQAIENYFMMTVSLANCRAALMRAETRGTHFRIDFPKRDDENWLCNITVRKVNDSMVCEKRPIVWSEVPPAKVKKWLAEGWKR